MDREDTRVGGITKVEQLAIELTGITDCSDLEGAKNRRGWDRESDLLFDVFDTYGIVIGISEATRLLGHTRTAAGASAISAALRRTPVPTVGSRQLPRWDSYRALLSWWQLASLPSNVECELSGVSPESQLRLKEALAACNSDAVRLVLGREVVLGDILERVLIAGLDALNM